MNMKKFDAVILKSIIGGRARDEGTLCPTCMKPIEQDSTIEINVKTETVRHAKCAELRPEQVKAIKELDNVMKSMKIRGI